MKISSSRLAYNILKKQMIQDVEEFWCIGLGPGLNLIALDMIFRGTVDSCTVHPRDIFRFAVLHNASQLILAHNHPSGDRKPSMQDLELTKRMITVGSTIEIPIIDHLILTSKSYTSLAEAKYLKFGYQISL